METSQLEKHLTSLEARLSKIEDRLQIVREPVQNMAPAPSRMPSPVISQSTIDVVPERPGNWLGILAVICFVLAAGFIIKLSIDSGWLTPSRQVGLAALLGLGLIGVGLTLINSDRGYASFLPGAGVIILYLTAFAANRYYALISFEVALGMTALISGLSVWLYVEIKHDIYPITAAVGAYIAPAILGLHADTLFSFYYFLICSIAFATISLGVQSRALTLVSSYLAIAMTSLVGLNLGQDSLVATVLAMHFLIFSVGIYFYSRHTEIPLSATEAWSFFPVLFVFYATEYYFIHNIHPLYAPWISLVFSGLMIGLYLSARKLFRNNLNSQPVIFSFVTIIWFHSIYLEILPASIRPWLFIGIVLGAAFVPEKVWSIKRQSSFFIPGFALLVIVVNEYLRMVDHLLNEMSLNWLILSFAALVSLWVLLIRSNPETIKRSSSGYALLGAAHILAILAFYRLVTEHGSLAVSASWLLYAVSIILFSFIRKDEVMAKSALFVLGFAAGKALLYDVSSASASVRILCLLLTGVVLYSCGFFIRKTGDWKNIEDI